MCHKAESPQEALAHTVKDQTHDQEPLQTFCLWAGPPVIMPGNGTNILPLDIVTDLLFRPAI